MAKKNKIADIITTGAFFILGYMGLKMLGSGNPIMDIGRTTGSIIGTVGGDVKDTFSTVSGYDYDNNINIPYGDVVEKTFFNETEEEKRKKSQHELNLEMKKYRVFKQNDVPLGDLDLWFQSGNTMSQNLSEMGYRMG